MSKQCTVQTLYEILDQFAPFDTAEDWDNVGLLVGSMDRPVRRVLTALDAVPQVIEEARRLEADLLICHHPLMFSPIRRLDEAAPEAALLCSMIRAGLSMIATHTNLDLAAGGVNDALAEALGWPVAETSGILRLGQWHTPQRLDDLASRAQATLNTQVIRFGPAYKAVTRFAICSGSGGSEVALAAQLGAQVLLTGEIKHDQALEAAQRGLSILACGHRATEICAADLLARHLQSALDAVELKVRVFVSQVDPFAG